MRPQTTPDSPGEGDHPDRVPMSLHPLLLAELARDGLSCEDPPRDAGAWSAFASRVSSLWEAIDRERRERQTREHSLTTSLGEMQRLYLELKRSAAHQLAEERERMSQGLAILRATLDTMFDGLLLVDDQRRVVMYNPQFVYLWNLPVEDTAFERDDQLMEHFLAAVEDPGEFRERVEWLDARPTESGRDVIRLHDGRVIDRLSAPVRTEEGLSYGRLWFFSDVTARYRAEEEVRRASHAKTEFLSNMSHELRTPLNSIIGFARVLDEGSFGPLGEHQKRYLSYILRSGDHMLKLVNDLLDLRRIEENRQLLELGDYALADVVEGARILVAAVVSERRHELIIDIPAELPRVHVDETALVQILVNLLSNAAKFTPLGGRIGVIANLVPPSAPSTAMAMPRAMVRIDVSDTGVGIAEEDQARLFTYFTQVGAKQRHHMKGSGVGLALTRAIVEKHGGSIWLTSTPGEGSVFSFTLPASASQDVTPAEGTTCRQS